MARAIINELLAKFTQNTASITEHELIKGWLETSLRKFNLVSKAEFDTQTAVLSRCHERLTELELQLKHLEEQLEHEHKISP